MCRSRDLTLSLFVWLFASATFAQQDPCLTRSVAVNVMTWDGNPVYGFHTEDFKAKLGRQSVDVVSSILDTDERRAVIVLDVSGSMTGKWRLLVAVAEGLLKSTPHTAFALLTFSDQIRESVGFNQTNGPVAEKLARLENSALGGRTALFDALHAALVLLTPPRLGDAIYVISDGGDNHSRLTEFEANKEFLASGVRLFGFVPVEQVASAGRTPEEAGGPSFLHALARESGGDLIFYGGEHDLRTTRGETITLPSKNPIGGTVTFAAQAFGREISEFYRLEIRLPEPLYKPRSWKLEMAEPSRTKGRPYVLIYPERFMPCGPQSD